MDKTVRLIDADTLIETINKNAKGNEGWYGDTWQFMQDVENAPTIDAVPVVRCKNCKFYGTPKNFKKPYCMRGAYVKVNADDYCSKGERR